MFGTKKNRLLIFGILLAILICSIPFVLYWVMETLPINSSKLSIIQNGMTQEAVREILGPPSDVIHYSESTEWQYSHSFKWCMVCVQFDKANQVNGIVIDR